MTHDLEQVEPPRNEGSSDVAGSSPTLRLLGWLILTIFVALAFRSVRWGTVARVAVESSPLWLGAAVVANSMIIPLSAWQVRTLIPVSLAPGMGRMLRIMSLTFTVSNGGPFLSGHAAGVHLLASRGGVGYATAVSVFSLDLLAEGIAKVAVLVMAMALFPLSVGLGRPAVGLLGVLVACGSGLVLVATRPEYILRRRTAAWTGPPRKVAEFLRAVADGMEALRRPRTFLFALMLGLAKKAMEALGIVAVAGAVGVALPAWGVVLVLAAVNVASMVSVTPAGLGIYEGSAVLAYTFLGVDPERALGIAMLQHLAYLMPMAGSGWLLVTLSGRRSAT